MLNLVDTYCGCITSACLQGIAHINMCTDYHYRTVILLNLALNPSQTKHVRLFQMKELADSNFQVDEPIPTR